MKAIIMSMVLCTMLLFAIGCATNASSEDNAPKDANGVELQEKGQAVSFDDTLQITGFGDPLDDSVTINTVQYHKISMMYRLDFEFFAAGIPKETKDAAFFIYFVQYEPDPKLNSVKYLYNGKVIKEYLDQDIPEMKIDASTGRLKYRQTSSCHIPREHIEYFAKHGGRLRFNKDIEIRQQECKDLLAKVDELLAMPILDSPIKKGDKP